MRNASSSGHARAARVSATILGALVFGTSLSACGSESGGADNGRDDAVDVVAYSTMQELYEQTLEPAFNETPAGKNVRFSNAFASSGDQSRAVENGYPADLVHLSIRPDIARLVDAGSVSPSYAHKTQNGGVVQKSIVVFVTRPGNPFLIRDWKDLVRDELTIITPNPFTSGLGRWNLAAAYGQAITAGASEQQAIGFVRSLLENTAANGITYQAPSADEALATFLSGQGEVLLTSESEAIEAIREGEELEYIIPESTITVETVAVVPETAQNPDDGQAFLDFLFSAKGQRSFAENGYRPVDPRLVNKFEHRFPTPPGLIGIERLGGWDRVTGKLFDREGGPVAVTERKLGVETE